mmetsp:Transcript_17200/g.26221  ORF Transcript_17200/g.26221 Transcript_17200/m.26221 type:complete len:98 (-) Transcript_17200:125-418(-)
MHLNSVDFPDPEEPKRTAGDVSGRKRTDSESAGRPDDDVGKNSRESGPLGGYAYIKSHTHKRALSSSSSVCDVASTGWPVTPRLRWGETKEVTGAAW